MKKLFLVVTLIGILFLDFLALDDITTNNQPSYLWEHAMLGSNIVLLPLLYVMWKQVNNSN